MADGRVDVDGRRSGAILLQGGGEMQPACRGMDEQLLSLAPPGPVVVVLGAATPGPDHEHAASRARRWYTDVARRPVEVTPHPEVDLDACVRAVGEAAVVVLPGGSPARLLDGLTGDGGRLARALSEAHAGGAALSGASAGAMVLCARTVLPERRGGPGPAVTAGLGLVPGLAVVHDDGAREPVWRDPDDPVGPRWGLPEAGGALVVDDTVRAVGRGAPRLLLAGASQVLPREAVPLPDLLGGRA
ncbi:Type 1 glutamine amidotransferase-like domain-containing protein [Aquipuribacter sp. SD81]|uniref:Type 1 glutamine amidotransferase-like domain-containing protein n=1 Tax=Aquipuribacter sp. SD81 TaxID=3127703 RepID=UPI003018E1D1